MSAGPLDGYRVIDLTQVRAGPTCTRQLADLGADVIWVGSPTRQTLAGSDGYNLTRNKRSILIDLASPSGRDTFLRLCRDADVVVENFRPSVKTRLGIGPKDVWEISEAIVYASISGFGEYGPYADRPGVDQIAQGMSGLMSVTGPEGTGPWRAGIAISDMAAGTFLTQGILAALLARERTGKGQWVRTSVLEALINFMDFQAVRWLTDHEVPEQVGNDHPTALPMGCFKTSDGYINLAGMLAWEKCCEVVGLAHLSSDPRFAKPAERLRNRDELRMQFELQLEKKSTSEWLASFVEAGIPAGPVYTVDQTFEDPQVQYLEVVSRVVHRDTGEVSVLNYPVQLSDTPASIRSGPPAPGEDTVSVLREKGFDEDEISDLLSKGVVATESLGTSWN